MMEIEVIESYMADSDFNEVFLKEKIFVLWKDGSLEEFTRTQNFFGNIIMPKLIDYIGMWKNEDKAYEEARKYKLKINDGITKD